ncbi:MAG TPA: hypothetical protein VIH08_14700 [Blastococcus sp.]
MSSARTPRPRLRRLATASAVAAAALAGAVVPTAVAAADEAAGATVVGELVQAWPEDAHHEAPTEHAAEAPLSWIQTAAGEAVRIPTEDIGGVPVGSTVRVTVGGKVEDDAAADGYDAARAVTRSQVVEPPDPDPAVPTAGATNQVTVAMVAPGGVARGGSTLAQVVRAVEGAADFWSEQSDGAIRIGIAATHDWLTTTADCSNPATLWDEAAAATGFVPGPGKHLLLYLSSAATDCSWALAQVGSTPASGGMLYVREAMPSAIAHELGHNFGLGHSSGLQCDAAVETGTCRTAGYRDYYDVMGASWSQLGSLNAAQAARLGVIPAAQQRSLSVRDGAVTVPLAPLAARTGTRVLRLTDASGVDYWLEYRTAVERDAWLGTGSNRFRLDPGVLLHRAGGLPDTALLLDGTPSTAAAWDRDLQASLPPGAAVTLSGGQFTVVVHSMSPEGAVLSVTPAPPAVAPAPAPAVAPVAPGGVMQGTSGAAPTAATGSSAAPEAAPAGAPAAPYRGPDLSPGVPDRPSLRSAADTTSRGGLLVPLAGVLLGGAAVLLVGRMRRRRGLTAHR